MDARKFGLPFLLAFCFLSSAWSVEPSEAGQPGSEQVGTLLDDSLKNLQEIESELIRLNNDSIKLKDLLTASQADSTALRSSLEEYRKRAEQLLKRQGELLKICSKLKESSLASNLAWQIGIPSALVVGIVAGVLVAKR